MDGRDSPLFLPGPPGHCCKIPSRLMANGQSMLRAQAGAAANENLDATTPGRERAWGAGAGCQAPTPAGFSLAPLNPSQQVHNTWAEGLRDRGRPGPASSVLDGMLGREQESSGYRCPSDCRPQGLAGRGWGTGRESWCSPCLPSMAGAATPPGQNLSRPVGTHRRRQALPHSRTAVAGFAPGQGGAGQSPFRFLFLPMPLLEASHRLPRGDMKEEETQ